MPRPDQRIWGTEPIPRLNTVFQYARRAVRGRRGPTLEVGCGAGRFLRALRRVEPGLNLFGCDLNLAALRAARAARAAGPGAYVAADAQRLPFSDGQFATLLVFDVIEHLPCPGQALRELRRVARPGALLHLLVPCEGEPGTLHWLLWKLGRGHRLKERQAGHIQRFRQADVLRLLPEAGFQVESVAHSMHWSGQVVDHLLYLREEPAIARRPFLRGLVKGLVLWLKPWAYLHSRLLSQWAPGAVNLHVTARAREVRSQNSE